jgi:predicted nucleic acid-binding protein
MIVDTSVWIEFYNSTTSAASNWLHARIASGEPVVVPELVLMELLIGTTDEAKAAARRRSLLAFEVQARSPIADCEDAAAIHRRCRRAGKTIRNLTDCQIAAMALRLDLPVAHRDRDFEVIAEHCGLRTVPLLG